MSFRFYLFLFLLFFSSTTTALWPIPASWSKGDEVLRVYSTLSFRYSDNIVSSSAELHKIIHSATQRLLQFMKEEKYTPPNKLIPIPERNAKTVERMYVEIESDDVELGPDTDESYELIIPVEDQPITCHLKAKTVYGLLHGLTTFSLLLYSPPSSADLVLPDAPHHITDRPRFHHRGLLLDTSRNFYPETDILRTLDVMSWNKMNVFHWHIVDQHSWPVKSEVFPELSEKGAYDPNDMVYSKREIETIVEYARMRGIRVIPEFDMPGHTYPISLSHPEIMTCLDQQPNWNWYAAEPPSGQLNPILPKTYDFVRQLITELSSWFPDKFWHTGGDEVNTHCWESTDSIREYLSSNPGTSISMVLQTFLNVEYDAVRGSGKTPITWEEILLNQRMGLAEDVVIQVWTSSDRVKQVVDMNYRVIVGPADYWYLDCGHGAWVGDWVNGNSWCDPFKTWQKMYSYNPVQGLSGEEIKYILGGEVLLWSEQADTTNFESLLWPRSSAAAEILWSGATDEHGNPRSVQTALPRLHDMRFRMVGRGIRAEPLQPLWCARTGRCNLPPSMQ
ncbi:6081_t:CDS:2 [Paraglomus occultum]|uniref:Beta-hexosaminidase n=1 Tax=Paraglomus occultum TaxID=144539 RepID=A0A9N9AQQ7_9GLOM|nr:6081_t:CDS:2 [Paraglomus occultum]